MLSQGTLDITVNLLFEKAGYMIPKTKSTSIKNHDLNFATLLQTTGQCSKLNFLYGFLVSKLNINGVRLLFPLATCYTTSNKVFKTLV